MVSTIPIGMIRLAVGLVYAFLFSSSTGAALRYRMIDIGPPVPSYSGGFRVNSFGVVTTFRPWVFRPGQGWRRTWHYSSSLEARTVDVNNRGDVLAHIQGHFSNAQNHPAVYRADGSFVRIPMPPGMEYHSTSGMNAKGEAVGTMVVWPEEEHRGWLYRPGSGTFDLGASPDGPGTRAIAINDIGDVAGYHQEQTSDGKRYTPHVWIGGSIYVNLGRPPGRDFVPTAINSHGDITGWSSFLDSPQIRLGDGTWVQVAVPGKMSSAACYDINDDRWAVGSGSLGNQPRTFLWRPGFGTMFLDELVDSTGAGWTFLMARGISDNGYIVGTGEKPGDSYQRAFLMAPYES